MTSTMQKRIAKVLSVTTSITTTLFVSGAASFAPVANAAVTINEGDIFRASNDYKVYIAKHVGSKKFKRWFVGPQMFDIYKHLGFAKVKVVDPSVAASYTESKLVRVDGDDKVWYIGNAVAGQSAEKQWIPTLATFQGAGFDWDGVYVINGAEGAWYAMGANYGGAQGATPTQTPSGGTIGASLASDNPAGAVLPGGSAFNPVLKVTLVGGPATVSGITLTKYGFVANTKVTGVSVWDAQGMRHGNIATSLTSDNKVTIGFGANPIVLNGTAQTITIAANLDSTATSGTLYMGIASSSDITSNGTVGGAFPLMGNLFTLTGGNNIGAYTVASQTVGGAASSATANTDVGETQKEVAKFKFTETTSNEDIRVESLVLYIEGDITESTNVLNWKLYDPANTLLASADRPYDRYVTFKLANPYVIAKGLQKVLTVKADFKDGANRWIRVHVQNDYDNMVRGVNSNIVVLPTSFTDQADSSGYFKMRQGSVTISKSANAPSGQVSVGGTDVVLGKFTLRAQGEDMEVRKMDVQIVTTGANTPLTGNISVRDENGTVTYVTISAATGSAVYSFSSTRFDLSTYVQLTSNTDKVITVYGNVSSSAQTTDSYQVSIGNLYVKRLSSIDFTDTATTLVPCNTLSVVATDATLAKNTAMGPVTVPPGLSGAKIGSFVVQSGTAEDARISNVVLDFSNASEETKVQNLMLKVNGVQQGNTISSPTNTANSFAVSINAPKSTPVIVDVYGDVKSDASGSLTLRFDATSSAKVTFIGLNTSTSITRPASGQTALQAVTFGAGTLKITKDSSSPTEQILTPVNGALLGNWKFEAKNEDLKLAKVTFSVKDAAGALGTAPVSNFGTLTLKDGSTVLATGNLVGNDVIFSGFNLTIPASGSKILSLYVDLTGSGTQTPGSMGVWAVKSDVTPTDIDVTGTNGELAQAAIDGGQGVTAESYFATSTRFLYHNSKPVVSAASNTPTGTHSAQQNDAVLMFTVQNSGTRDMRLGSLTVTVSTSGGAATGTVSTFDLYDGTTKIAANALSMGANSSSIAVGFHTGNAISGAFDNFVVSAGASKTFTVKANTSAIRSGLSSGSYVTLSTQIAGSTGSASASAWNTGNVEFFYTPVYGTETGPFYVSDSYPVSGGTLTY